MLRNLLALIAGFVVGSLVNMLLISIGPMIFPPPPGVDLSTPEGLKAAMPQFEPHHYLTPFLAHALGTLVGAFIAAKLSISRKMTMALAIGALFLVGGIAMVVMINPPVWYAVVDLALAYFPMAYLGAKLAIKNKGYSST
jgi:hypothetical protein